MKTMTQVQSRQQHIKKTPCAFCGGTGRDPFGVMSPLATCQVCGGKGWRELREPLIPCAFCQGTGVHPGSRLTCTSCGGVGMVEAPANTVSCPSCRGSGHSTERPLPCTCCSGKGIIAAERLRTKRSIFRKMRI